VSSNSIHCCCKRCIVACLSIACLWFLISVLYSNCLCKMRRFGDIRLLTTVSSKPGSGVTQGHRKWHHSIACIYGFLLSSYSNFESKMHHFRDMTTYWSKIAEKTYPPSFGTFLWGDPLRIFRQLTPCQKLESWGYQMVYISRSCFRSARHNTGVWQTDGQTDGQTRCCCKDRASIPSRG